MLNTEILVKQALASALHYQDIESIHNEAHLRNDLQLDSMGSLMFLMKLEESIDGFYVDPETMHESDLETVNSVIGYVNSQTMRTA
ncbi:MAG: hypothetical protein A3I77_08280 [Gammaproteobacteria bacterium RIFCSPLOWO2_02_FULL_42_14]|nr:MAG: hypothetical protein A3B71_04115 [Gammaproteobacteria bacterium RIFCSPHIGHO2_02_FULL_42_43]OGT27586.1 MAG: hypothetical protein A2624_00420 [Gammaproteobacteria bacterium RIFCSPHIGHO2_01_FULL_42_8]OGT52899.1 MAG: hypothetical protein A3E54_07410 [Gammaproteobacteria bacterium RIFCSPHIGHO2_12_FULL_41_25]OGT61328.1 MAG: hypothetical protein A3I77_08280 [Gammaproteobacteria bacterium RIFCSPLOWO2_02_FULL_42_14]OGT87257.1 MAG: hypothetical protein A3G86_02005 [Gammaproteobacteria bacterium R